MKVFLGGTCAESKWREILIPQLACEYFNPVVEDWTPECQEIEEQEKVICNYHLYVITPKMQGVFSIAEATNDSIKLPDGHCVFCITKEDDDRDFTKAEMKSLNATAKLIESNGGKICHDLVEVANYLNCEFAFEKKSEESEAHFEVDNSSIVDKSSKVELKFKKLEPNAVIPKYAHDGDVGMDITATWVGYDDVYDMYIYHTDLALESDKGYGVFLFPRSSNCKTDAYLTNSVGIIDSALYRGEIQFRYKNRKPYKKSLWEIITGKINTKRVLKYAPYKHGDRIGQMVVLPYPPVSTVQVDELSDTERGTGGFGSTGK